MAYEKQTWENGEFDEFDTLLNPETAKITADKMNHIEDGIGTLGDAVGTAQEQLSQIAESLPTEDLEQLKETVAAMQETINSLVTGKYDGQTTVTPASTEQTLSTANTWLDEDVTVEGIPYTVEPNDTGDTVIIGDD